MQPPQVVEACHQCLKWLIPQLDTFPRNRRFTLGERIESNLLDTLTHTTQAVYTPKIKLQLLVKANQHCAVVRHLWRLCYELKVIDKKRYQYGSEIIVDIGRQIGGWTRQCQR